MSNYREQIKTSYIMEHSGIKGQKWGVRRYQNPDGTLTEAGKARSKKYLNNKVLAATSDALKYSIAAETMRNQSERYKYNPDKTEYEKYANQAQVTKWISNSMTQVVNRVSKIDASKVTTDQIDKMIDDILEDVSSNMKFDSNKDYFDDSNDDQIRVFRSNG